MGTQAISRVTSVSLSVPSQITLLSSPAFSSSRVQSDSGRASFRVKADRRDRACGVRCSTTSEASGSNSQTGYQSPLPLRDHYQLLGVPIEASREEIRQAYRKLQKKHHPDIVGKQGHAMTLLLNEAYQTLIDEDLRAKYNAAHTYIATRIGGRHQTFTGSSYSLWVGPDRPQGIFVDENVCVGCQKCVCAASNTFEMDELTGCAKVKAQWADPEWSVTMAREVCPVNCIHLVEREDLPILEYLICPQPKPSNGVYGGGWERPSNVFMAAATLKRQLEEQRTQPAPASYWETHAQRKARVEADMKLRMGPFWKLWSWAGQPAEGRSSSTKGYSDTHNQDWSWKGLFGRSSTMDLLMLPVSEEMILETVAFVQDWALTYASSSELPLPLPFRTDILPNGVQLSLVTVSNGTVSSIGSLVVTVEETSVYENGVVREISQNAETSIGSEHFLRVRRQGTTGTQSLPGEGRIVRELKAAVLGGESYTAYHFGR